MKISVVTPSYNQGRFIKDCLSSVRAEAATGKFEVEHIVVDACSTDETVSVLQEWQNTVEKSEGEKVKSCSQPSTLDPRPSTQPTRNYSFQYTSEPDKGQTDAINKGFRRSSGDWVMWLNADDYLLPGALEQVISFAAKHPDADVIYGDCLFVDEHKNTIRERRERAFSFNMLHFYGCYIQSTACFYSRRVLDRGIFLDPKYKVCMDYEYYLKLAHAGCSFVHIPELLAGFRWHGENISSTNVKKRLAERIGLQREYLANRGLSSLLGNKMILEILFRAYQVERSLYRMMGKRRAAKR
jgi:glycosyltransferase involved in cell wall biosynthesis